MAKNNKETMQMKQKSLQANQRVIPWWTQNSHKAHTKGAPILGVCPTFIVKVGFTKMTKVSCMSMGVGGS